VTELLSLLRSSKLGKKGGGEGRKEAGWRAVEQLRWIRTPLSEKEVGMVLEGCLSSYGWKAGLKYCLRKGEEQQGAKGGGESVKRKHFHRVIETACRWREEGEGEGEGGKARRAWKVRGREGRREGGREGGRNRGCLCAYVVVD